jgi:hypothetical protein
MPRGRRPLTDKQERILVQCQLMGMTTADLVTVSNRLKALDRENEFRVRVNEVTDGFTWTIKDKRNFVVIDGSGAVYDCSCYTDYSGRDWTRHGRDYIKVTVSYPGTRKKSRTVSDHRLTSRWEEDEIVSVCPEGSKYLYRVLRDIKTGRFE